MTQASPPPPLTAFSDLAAQMAASGYAVLEAAAVAQLAGWDRAPADWSRWWQDLPPDRYLRDGGRYRRRRHGCFVVDGEDVEPVPHRAHWQPVEYNALHGGLERWFEPLPQALVSEAGWAGLLRGLVGVASGLWPELRWYVEAHAFRIDTTDGIGRPTPEGAHRDGVDLVAVFMLARAGVKGGETRVFDARGPQGMRFTLREPWSLLLLDDWRVVHETTPIQPLHPAHPAQGAAPSHRDTLVVTLRRGGFQGP